MKKPSANIMYLEFGSTKMEYPTPSNQRLGCALRHLRFGQLDDYKVELKYSKMLGIPKTAGASRLRIYIYIYSYIIFKQASACQPPTREICCIGPGIVDS